MSKIVQVVNTMISNKEKIRNCTRDTSVSDNYFFEYGSYKWSVVQYENEGRPVFEVTFYKSDSPVSNLASLVDRSGIEKIWYSTETLATREAFESFSELFVVVKERTFGADQAFDKIIDGHEGVPF